MNTFDLCWLWQCYELRQTLLLQEISFWR